MKYCKFCGEELIPVFAQSDSFAQMCNNHDQIFVLFLYNEVFLCKDQYEISFGNGFLRLSKHVKYESIDSDRALLSRNGYYYMETAEDIVAIDVVSVKNNYVITPENFDFYLDKLKTLAVLS